MSIKIDVVTELNRRTTRETATEAQQYFERAGRDAGNSFGTNLSQGIDSASPKVEKSARNIEKSFDKAADAAGRLRAEQEKLDALVARGDAPREKLVAQSVRVEKARRDESSAIRDVSVAYRDFSTAAQTAGSAAASAAGQVGELAGSATKLSSALGPAGIAAAVVIGGQAILQLGGIAASASQSLLLLPAAAGAAGAAFGTLALATLGFGDAIKDIRDPEKFAEDLRALSPVAQEAALAIQSLLPSFDQLKNATQDAFFNGVGGMLNQLTNQYLPTIQSATTGIASAFNSAMSGVTNQLLTPETQTAISTFLANTVQAFQALAPAVAPLTKALADIMSVGSGFLPGLAQAATDAANSFSRFITEASRSGQLKEWLGQGLETLKGLGSIAWDLGRAFLSLAPLAKDSLPVMVEMFKSMANIVPIVVRALEGTGPALRTMAELIKRSNDAFDNMKTIVGNMANAVIPIINSIGGAVDKMLQPLRAGIGVANSLGASIPEIPSYTGLDQIYTGGGRTLPKVGQSLGGLPTAGIGPGSAAPTGVGLGSGFSYRPPPDQVPAWGDLPAGYTPPSTARAGGGPAKGHVEDTHGTLVPNAANLENVIKQLFPQVQSIGGYRAPDGYNEHSSGEALDIMVGANKQLGDQINQFLLKNADALGIQYDLWQQTQWDPNGVMTPMHDRGSPTANHRDHVHARVKPGDPATGNYMDPGMSQYKMGANGPQPVNVEGFGASATSSLQGIFAPMDSDLGIGGGLPGIAKYFTTLLGNMALAGAIGSSPTLQAAAFGPGGISPVQGFGGPSAMGPTPIGGGLGAPLVGGMPGMGPLPGPVPGGLGGAPGVTAAGNLAGAWGPGGVPSMGGMGGGMPGSGMGMPSALGSSYQGVGMGASNPQSMQPASTGGGGGGIGVDASGLLGGAAAMIPGAQQGIKLASRAIQQAGQYAAIGVSGLMETFLPHDSALAGNSWGAKLAGGLAGARPAQPNQAGQAAPPMPQGNDHMPNQVHDNSVNIANMSTEGKDGQGVANDIARYQAGGPR